MRLEELGELGELELISKICFVFVFDGMGCDGMG